MGGPLGDKDPKSKCKKVSGTKIAAELKFWNKDTKLVQETMKIQVWKCQKYKKMKGVLSL